MAGRKVCEDGAGSVGRGNPRTWSGGGFLDRRGKLGVAWVGYRQVKDRRRPKFRQQGFGRVSRGVLAPQIRLRRIRKEKLHAPLCPSINVSSLKDGNVSTTILTRSSAVPLPLRPLWKDWTKYRKEPLKSCVVATVVK